MFTNYLLEACEYDIRALIKCEDMVYLHYNVRIFDNKRHMCSTEYLNGSLCLFEYNILYVLWGIIHICLKHE